MKLIRRGATRWVILISRWAIKIPSLHSYRHFLQGILGNEQETYWSRTFKYTGKLCPVLFTCPGRFFIVMPRVKVLTDAELPLDVDIDIFLRIYPDKSEFIFPVEKKTDSFGWLNGRLVIIDYGS